MMFVLRWWGSQPPASAGGSKAGKARRGKGAAEVAAAAEAAPVAADAKDALNRLLCLLINVVELDDGTRCASPADRPRCVLYPPPPLVFRPVSRS